MQRFEGLWVPLITPFHDNAIDVAAIGRLVEHLLDGGVDGLVVCGTTGEAATLDSHEQQRVLAAVIEAAAGRCPIVFGIAGNDTARLAQQVGDFSIDGVDGFLISPPQYVRPAQAGILHHYRTLAAATDRAIVLYNIPYRTGVNLELATVQRLAEHPRIVAIKESGAGNHEQLVALIDDTPLTVLSGEDAMIYTCACLGGHGAIAASAHLRPDVFKRMLTQIAAGDLPSARAIARALRPLIRLLFAEPNPAPLKAALARSGMIRNELRAPMMPAAPELARRIAEVLDGLDDADASLTAAA